jgi:hypothetical protein
VAFSPVSASASSGDEQIVLDEWLAAHGPLEVTSAYILALSLIRRVNQMKQAELGRSVASLSAASITREEEGWTWNPVSSGAVAVRVRDEDVVERIGFVLYHAISGEALIHLLPSEEAVRKRLREARPDLPANVGDLVIDAVLARQRGRQLPHFASGLRGGLGVEPRNATSSQRRLAYWLSGVGAAVAVAILAWQFSNSRDVAGPRGLTADESRRVDGLVEAAQTFAVIGEHTAAYGRHDEASRLWRSRVSPDDPRLTWAATQNAWVRTLAGDRLTAEQVLNFARPRLAAALGEDHPYTRAARLSLAATIEARGGTSEVAALRAGANSSARSLLDVASLGDDLLPGVPVPPAVLAHVAPNDPIREGFRPGVAGEHWVPLTTMQRSLQDAGWRLHVVAMGPCRASVAVGDPAREVVLEILLATNNGWTVRVDGLDRPLAASSAAGPRINVSLLGDGGGVGVHVAGANDGIARHVSANSSPAVPYGLRFVGDPASGCEVVWLEIAFPSSPMP